MLSSLASALYFFPQETERRYALSRQAVAMARRLGDTATLATVLNSHRWVLWNPESLPERLATSREIVRLAEATGAYEVALRGWLWLWVDVLENGEILLVNVSRSKRSEMGRTRGRFRDFIKPRNNATDINGYGRHPLLQMGFG
jgi:hypothetical protein